MTSAATVGDIERIREKVALKFCKALGDDESAAVTGKNLEIVLWNSIVKKCTHDCVPLEWLYYGPPKSGCMGFKWRYTTRASSLALYNIPHVADKLKTGEIPLKKFIDMDPWEIREDLWAPVFEKVAYKSLKRQLTVDVENAPDGMFQCHKCRSRKTTFYQMQTRSADEPMTCFVQCLNCQQRWKS
jgi:DNA-directed RNA polymerase subunit M/transcription elongation factor TFIIS